MDPMWLDREAVDRLIEGIDFKALKYDPDTGQYCLDGVPFTGVTKTRWKNGSLQGVGYHKNGVECGVSVAWYLNGQIHLYSEMDADVYHGWHMEWSEDGTKQVEAHYSAGRLDNLKR